MPQQTIQVPPPPGRTTRDGPPDLLDPRNAVITTTQGGATIVQMPARPLLPNEVAALRAARSELSSQLISASGRRDELAQELRNATSQADRMGIEQRMAVLDKRIVQLESDIAETGRQLTSAPSQLVTTSGSAVAGGRLYGPFNSDQLFGLSMASIVLIFFPLAFAAARRMWKRPPIAPAGAHDAETAQRLVHLTDAIDAIAIEVERVSEGQRFVTRLLSDQRPNGQQAALGAPAAEPIPVGRYEAQHVGHERG